MAKKKKKYGQYAAACVVAAAVGLGAYAWFSDFDFGDLGLPFGTESGTNDTNNDNNGDNQVNPPEDNQTPDPNNQGGQNDENAAGGQDEVPRRIDVYGDRIVFDGNDITLEDLDAILVAHGNATDVWELHDAQQASVVVFNAVIDLFQQHEVMLAER